MLHLVKLCVGVETPHALQQRQAQSDRQPFHATRMWPRQSAQILQNGGSLYWVMNGAICCRQKIIDFSELQHNYEAKHCGIFLDRTIWRTYPKNRRAFQGWRYLEGKDAPDDLPANMQKEGTSLPQALEIALREIGVC